MNRNIIGMIAIAALIVGGGAFYGGMMYVESKTPSNRWAGGFQNFQNLSAEERQQMAARLPAGAGGSRRGSNGGSGVGFTAGEVINKDEQSVTLKLPDGGSKIIFFSESTDIGKMTEGTIQDLTTGVYVTATGKTNDDGSVTAETIQVRPQPAPVSQ